MSVILKKKREIQELVVDTTIDTGEGVTSFYSRVVLLPDVRKEKMYYYSLNQGVDGGY